jgi:glycerophosphoryl diester phosphodiesterase
MSARNPLLDPNARIVIAHRGNRVRAPENTLASLRQAVELGADALEFDVRVSRDGVAVLMHDPMVDRTTDGSGMVSAMSLAELRTLDASARSAFRAERTKIPTLEEALNAFRDMPLVIEVKELAAASATAAQVRRFNLADQVLIGSVDTRVMEWFYGTEFHRCASMRDAARFILNALRGRRPSARRYDVLSITTRFRGMPIPVRAMAKAARQEGVPTHVWTVNDPAVARRLWLGGVAGIVTDDPETMLKARP